MPEAFYRRDFMKVAKDFTESSVSEAGEYQGWEGTFIDTLYDIIIHVLGRSNNDQFVKITA